MNADPYRGEWGGKQCRDSPIQTTRSCNCSPGQCVASGKYVDQLEEVLRYSAPKGRVGGFFAESIQVFQQDLFKSFVMIYDMLKLIYTGCWRNSSIPKGIFEIRL